jgi:hypothetical protein
LVVSPEKNTPTTRPYIARRSRVNALCTSAWSNVGWVTSLDDRVGDRIRLGRRIVIDDDLPLTELDVDGPNAGELADGGGDVAHA